MNFSPLLERKKDIRPHSCHIWAHHLLKKKTQTSPARLAAGIDSCPFSFVLQHQILKELKTHTMGSKAVNLFLHTSVLMQINLFTLCNEMHTVFWSVWMSSSQSAKDIDLPLLQQSHCSSQVSQVPALSMIGPVPLYRLVAMARSGAFLSILKYFIKYNTFPSCSIWTKLRAAS